jgi:hypothetical protein
MTGFLGLAPTFAKGLIAVVAALILFVGSVYLILSAVFGLRMAYLVVAVSFFGWMLIFASIWVFQPTIFGVRNVVPHQGPRGTEAHWQVFAAGTGPLSTRFLETGKYPGPPWRVPSKGIKSSVDNVKAKIQLYLADQASKDLEKQGQTVCDPNEPLETDCVTIDPTTFGVTDIKFASSGRTSLAAGHAFFTAGGPEITVYTYHDSGDVPVYSWAFLVGSAVGFVLHVPFLDRAEKKRKAILTGGTAPPWYGPA